MGLLTVGSPWCLGQWQTQTFALKQGWNAVYTHVDAKHTTIEQLVPADGIEEVWMWSPKLSTMQYIKSPDQPLDTVSRWTSWISTDAVGSSLQRLIGNAAYLVKAGQAVNWGIKGKPVPPRYQWTSTGLNLIGFSTKSASPPLFSNFLNPVNGFGAGAQIFNYNGGDLGATNPAQLFALNTSPVHRGQAYWIRATGYNRYYGPFELGLQDWSGVHFGDSLSSYKVVLKNTTKSELNVSMQLVGSEAAPVQEGIPTVAGTPPIIVRGNYQLDTLTNAYSAVNGNTQLWTLKPSGEAGSAVEIHLGVHWAQLTGNAGDKFAGIVRFTDSLGYLQTDLPLTVTKPRTSGLWVGQATVNQVRHGMNTFQKSFVKGAVKAAINGTLDAPVTVSWLKNAATQTKIAGKTYVTSDAGFHLVETKAYSKVTEGDALWLPPADENGSLLTSPATYWKARPHHVAFVQGWFYSLGSVVATGNKTSIDVKFVKRTVATIPAGFTVAKDATTGVWHYESDVTYTGAAVDDALAPPSNDEAGAALDSPLAYWDNASDASTTWAQADDGSYKAAAAGDITLKWRKITAETTVYESITVADQPTLYQHEYKTITKTVFPRQRLTGGDILTADMPADEWIIFGAPTRPPFAWEGTLAKGTTGAYVVAHTDSSWGAVAKPMKLRVIVHNDAATAPVANLLQRVYIGIDNGNGSLLLSTEAGLLPDATPDVRRVSSVHLPWSKANLPWQFSGSFAKGGTLSATVTVAHDEHASNPFLHTYHPDHDNLDARFEKKLVQGQESYEIKREITLRLNGSQAGFDGLARGSSVISGEYEEIVTLSGKAKLSGAGYENRQYGMKGTVAFSRITPVATLRTE